MDHNQNQFSAIYAPSPAELIFEDRARQLQDLSTTLNRAGGPASALAQKLRDAGAVTLLGMGASHCINLIVADRLRHCGISAHAVPPSVLLASGCSIGEFTVLTSQSAHSGEICEWLDHKINLTKVLGLVTLNETIAPQGILVLRGSGGQERGLSATRSFTLSLGLWSLVLKALGAGSEDHVSPPWPEVSNMTRAAQALSRPEFLVAVARGGFEGLAHNLALSLNELGAGPAVGFDSGQFRHGPLEVLSEKSGVIVLRHNEQPVESWARLVASARDAGAVLVVLDASAAPPLAGATTVRIAAPGAGMSAILTMALHLQELALCIASMRTVQVGQARFINKVTTDA